MTRQRTSWLRLVFPMLLLLGLVSIGPESPRIRAQSTGDWPMYLGDVGRSGANLAETTITSSTANYLTYDWAFATGGRVVSSPIVENGVLYVGAWDGYEYAVNVGTHQQLWRTYLGITTSTQTCYGSPAGISSSAAVQNGILYVGGGDGYLYALNTADGSVAWRTFLGAPPYYNWSSPLLYNNLVYIGLSAYCDPPNAQGEVLALNQSNGSIAASVSLVPNGSTGAAVWSSPAVDVTTGRIYVTTGNDNSATLSSQPNAEAFLALDSNTLAILDRWQIPASDQPSGGDSDFGAAPTLFDVNGVGYVGAINKNGIYYVLNRANLASGPVWEQNVGGTPLTTKSHVAPSCFANGIVFVASGPVEGTSYLGSVHAFDAATGNPLWTAYTAGIVYGALFCAPGIVVDGQGRLVEVRDASSGRILFNHAVGRIIQGPSVISNGELYTPSNDNAVYAFTIHNTAIPQLIFQNTFDAYAPRALPTGPGTDQWTSLSASGTSFAVGVSSAQSDSAPNALQITLGNGTGHANARKNYPPGTGYTTHAARFNLYLDPGLNTSGQTIALFTSENASNLNDGQASVRLTGSRKLTVVWYGSTGQKHVVNTSAQLSSGVWYTLELDQFNDPASGSWSLWVNGSQVAGQSGIDTGNTQITSCLAGDSVSSSSSSSMSGSFYEDDIVTAATQHIG